MFYPNDYEVKLLKEQEIRERVARAEIDNYARSIHVRRASLFTRSLRSLLHFVAHVRLGLGKQLDSPRIEPRPVRRSNATRETA